MTETTYNKQLLSLTAIFILGDSIIILPYSAGNPILGFLVSAAAAILLFFCLHPLLNKLLVSKSRSKPVKILSDLILAAVAAYALYCAGHSFRRFVFFAEEILLPEAHRFFIAAVFLITVWFLASRRQEVILKLALIFVFAAAVTVILFFLLCAKDFKFSSLEIRWAKNISELWGCLKPYFRDLTLPSLLIPAYTVLFSGKRQIMAPLGGLLIGILLIFLCLICSLLLFGVPLSAELKFPISSAVSTVTVGPLFSRMDGVVYCLFFASSLIKTSLCGKLCFRAIKKIRE